MIVEVAINIPLRKTFDYQWPDNFSHLPQIASRANHHLHISKKNLDQKTTVEVAYLNQEDRIAVISQLYGTVKMSGKMEQTYRSMINTAHG